MICLTSTPGSPARPVTGSADLAERLDDLASAESRAPHSSLPRPRTRHRVSALGASSRQPVREAAIGRARGGSPIQAQAGLAFPAAGRCRAAALQRPGLSALAIRRPQMLDLPRPPGGRNTRSGRRSCPTAPRCPRAREYQPTLRPSTGAGGQISRRSRTNLQIRKLRPAKLGVAGKAGFDGDADGGQPDVRSHPGAASRGN